MNTLPDAKDIFFINPYDTKGGASMGTFRLFSYFRKYISAKASLRVIVKNSSESIGVYGLPGFFRVIFYLQALFNKLLCRLSSIGSLPVAVTFFVPFSLPALVLFFNSRRAFSVYLHSMGSGFSCPSSFSLLISSASVVKTADDWYLTGGCHYSLECNQWRYGCKSCPLMNPFGKLIVRLNWLLKRIVLSRSSRFVFVSPSKWLSSRYEYLYPGRCSVIYNSASGILLKTDSSSQNSPPNCQRRIGDFSPKPSSLVTFGLPVTYLRDKRKGFHDALPSIIQSLENYPIHLVLCGGDASDYFDLICAGVTSFHPLSKVQSLGPLKSEDMHFFYPQLDFILHFARYDNSPNVITEALCSGVPAVVLDDAGSPEHIRLSSAGFVLDEVHQLNSIVELICSGSVNISKLKLSALRYSKIALSPKAMAVSYSKLLT